MKSEETFFVKQLKKAMIDKNLNQKDLGRLIGVNQQMISRWLTGNYNPSFTSIKKIAKALEIPANYLMDEQQENPNSENDKLSLIIKLIEEKDLKTQERLRKLEDNFELLKNRLEK